jgi:hypothetical protein
VREPVTAVTDHAAENLRFIRHAMERSTTFSAVPGLGGALMGTVGLAAAVIGALQPTAELWLVAWLSAAAIAVTIGLVAIRAKATRLGLALAGPPVRRFALGLLAPFLAGAALTFGLWRHGAWALIPPTWLLLYGTGVLTGGAFSVAPLRLLGLAFMTLGVAALITPAEWSHLWLGLGFGGLQIVFGVYVARRHGG